MKIVFMGTPFFAQNILSKLNNKYEVSLVITKVDQKAGRKQILTPSIVKRYCSDNNIKVLTCEKVMDVYEDIKKVNPDLIITAAYGKMIPSKILNEFLTINVHASLLPKYRGGAPIEYAMFNGDKETGISIMKLVKKMDAGPVYLQDKIAINYNETKTILTEKLSNLGFILLDKFLANINKYKPINQDESKATYAYNIKYEDQILDFNKTQKDVHNKVKALQNEPGAIFFHKKTLLKLVNTKLCDIIKENVANKIKIENKRLFIGCQDGYLEVLQIQEQGKKVLFTKDFLNGQKIFANGEMIINDFMKENQ